MTNQTDLSESKPETEVKTVNDQSGKSIKDLWVEFSQSTGIHAVNKISSFSVCGRRSLIWTIAILCTTGFLIHNLVESLREFYRYPTRTTIKTDVQTALGFPAVTICNRCTLNGTTLSQYPKLELFYFANSLLGAVKYTEDDVLERVMIGGDIANRSISREWWQSVSMDGSKLLPLCFFGGVKINCSDVFKPVFTNQGLCHTFNGNVSDILKVGIGDSSNNLIVQYNVRQEDYTYVSNMAAGVMVYLHEPDVDPDTSISVVAAPPGFSTYVGMERAEYAYLAHPFTAFDNEKCVDATLPGFRNPLRYHPRYTYKHCLKECGQREALSQCGCVGPDDPQDAPICSPKEKRCYDRVILEANKNVTFQSGCRCVAECHYTHFRTRTSYSAFPADVWSEILINATKTRNRDYMRCGKMESTPVRSNLLELRIYYENMVIVSTTQHPQMSVNSIFSNIGGQMGLCLGASLLTVTELAEFIVFVVLFIWQRFRQKKNDNKIKEFK